MPPSIGLKTSAVICGKSAVVFPAAFASSIGSFFSAAREREQHTRDEIAADSSEADGLASGWEECLHRHLVHICLVNLVARKILSANERRDDNHCGKPGRSSGIARPASTGDKTGDPASMNLVELQRVTTKLSDDDQQTPA
jgi:hypothetical protein